MSVNLLYGLSNGEDLFGVLVGELDSELVFNGHGDLNLVKGVETEVLYEVGIKVELLVCD